MRFPILRHLGFRPTPQRDAEVVRDADELMLLWGGAAYERATDLSWDEDTGRAASPRPGHWWRVRREIGRRLDVTEREPVADFAV